MNLRFVVISVLRGFLRPISRSADTKYRATGLVARDSRGALGRSRPSSLGLLLRTNGYQHAPQSLAGCLDALAARL